MSRFKSLLSHTYTVVWNLIGFLRQQTIFSAGQDVVLNQLRHTKMKMCRLLDTFQLSYSTAAIQESKLHTVRAVLHSPVTHSLLNTCFHLCRACVCVCVGALTVKLLLTFFVLDSATLASDRSTSSKIRDCRKEEVLVEREIPRGGQTARRENGKMSFWRIFLTLGWTYRGNIVFLNLVHMSLIFECVNVSQRFGNWSIK